MNRAARLRGVFGVFGAVLALIGCDDVVRVRNEAPQLGEPLTLCTSEGRVYFALSLQDLEEDDVEVEIRAGGKPVLVGPVGDGATGLRSDRNFPGKHHFIEWAATDCEPGAQCPTASCTTLEDGALPTSSCLARPASPARLGLSVVASDGEDASPVIQVAAVARAGAELGECDFSVAAHE